MGCQEGVRPGTPGLRSYFQQHEKIRSAFYIDFHLFKKSLQRYDQNNFVAYLKRLLGPEKTQGLIAKFHIGTSKRWQGATIFWQMDLQGRLRTGKIMLYNPESGKRESH